MYVKQCMRRHLDWQRIESHCAPYVAPVLPAHPWPHRDAAARSLPFVDCPQALPNTLLPALDSTSCRGQPLLLPHGGLV